MMRKTATYTCYVFGCSTPAPSVGHMCEAHKAEHRAKWKEEHTRKPGDKRTGWLVGDKCRVKIGGIEYEAKILDMSDVSRRENNYDMLQLEISKTVKGLDGRNYTQTWTHPKPVQSYKLRKSYEE